MLDASNPDLQAPGAREPLRRVVDSTMAIAFARFFMPVALAIIGWFMVNTVSDIKQEISTANTAIWIAVKDVASKVNTQAVDIATLKANNDATTKSLDRLTVAVDRLTEKP